jgi:hypothetical protein
MKTETEFCETGSILYRGNQNTNELEYVIQQTLASSQIYIFEDAKILSFLSH